ncbi:MAG: caspase family protein [Candidatus Paceibacterota bacterium]
MNTPMDRESVPPQSLSPESQRRALLICNGQFQHLKLSLPGVQKDAENLSRALGDPHRSGFKVTCLLDKGLLEVRKAIAEACAVSGNDDTLLTYYSGTSVYDGGELLLPVADSDPTCLMATSIEAEFVLSQMRRSSCRRFVLIVDGCHSGGFFRNNRGVPDGMVAITSCSVDEMSADTPEGGAFTQSLLRALADPKSDRDHDGSRRPPVASRREEKRRDTALTIRFPGTG